MATRYTMMGTAAGVTAAVAAALVAMSGGERAQSLGLTQHGALITAQDAGAADAVAAVAVSPGTPGQVLTVSDAGLPHWAAASGGGGGGATVTTLYASDGTPVAGGGTASVSGSGVTSTFTLTGAGTSTYGSAGVTSPSISFALPAGAVAIEVETQITALNNVATSGFRFFGMVFRNSGTAIPTAAWGVSHNDNAVVYGGNMLAGLNSAPHTSTSTAWPFNNLDRWQRATLLPRVPQISVQVATASSGARPTTWTSLATPIPLLTSSSGAVPDTGVATALAIVLQSYSAGASTVTGRVTVRVTQ